ncbi:hypothetical protein [Domibacillus iocasae]|uniref:Uncharacterized protein n=1 Tax=Domibacillus iocasae TaxID=1714016 RepID=A0A1E7DRW5_9BACI|nr:hypothetical protein [Domibacillus iocasae]OES45824.1 hypothetical protein BA724_03200 [Domibacillus iocasae]
MLTNHDFKILFVAFTISIFLGLLLRIFYYSKTKFLFRRLLNVVILQIVFPIHAYSEIIKHRSEYIHSINRGAKISKNQKEKLKKEINSNRRVALRIIWNSIRRFKQNLDSHIELLNKLREKTGEEIVIKLEFEFKKDGTLPKAEYKEHIIDLYA